MDRFDDQNWSTQHKNYPGAAPAVLGRAAKATLRPACGPVRSLAAAAALRKRPRGRARSSSRPRPRPPWRPWKSRPAKGWRKRAAKSEAKGQHLDGGGGRQRTEAPVERGSRALRQNKVPVRGDRGQECGIFFARFSSFNSLKIPFPVAKTIFCAFAVYVSLK